MANGSVLIPTVRYRDAHAAIAWLQKAFGLTAQAVYEDGQGGVAHAQMTFGTGMLMLGSVPDDQEAVHSIQPQECGGRSTVGLYLVVTDAAAAYGRAQAAGAEITMELKDMDYGGKAFGCLDLEQHAWSFGEYDPWASS